jgi:hypothetical protein
VKSAIDAQFPWAPLAATAVLLVLLIWAWRARKKR